MSKSFHFIEPELRRFEDAKRWSQAQGIELMPPTPCLSDDEVVICLVAQAAVRGSELPGRKLLASAAAKHRLRWNGNFDLMSFDDAKHHVASVLKNVGARFASKVASPVAEDILQPQHDIRLRRGTELLSLMRP